MAKVTKKNSKLTTVSDIFGTDNANNTPAEELEEVLESSEELQTPQEESVPEVPVQEEEKFVPKVEIKNPTGEKSQPNVRIKPNRDLQTFIGDKWYFLKKGKQETVPQNVKEILMKAGVLDAI